jgi:hypothetical protein
MHKKVTFSFLSLVLRVIPHLHAFYEWINPINDQASGVYPFRTGITMTRIAIADILEKIKTEHSYFSYM